MAEQQLQAFVARLLAGDGQHDVLVFGAVDALGGHAAQEGYGSRDAGLDLGQRLLVVMARHL